MAVIYGAITLADTDRIITLGYPKIYEIVNQFTAAHNAEADKAYAIFVEMVTESFKENYKLPGGGRMQRRGGQAQSAAVKAGGSWDVGFSLEDFGDQVAGDDVSMAYMTAAGLQLHLDTIRIRDINTRRYEILKALLNNTQRPFTDPIHGTVNVEPLANGDSVVYPPVLGSETEATENHYLESGYAASAISDTNNPIATSVTELEEHFGAVQGFGRMVTFINPAQVAKVEALTDFVQADVNAIVRGNDDSRVVGLPNVPGRIIGHVSGAYVSSWQWMPANYMYTQDLDQRAPLKVRVDPADTQIPRGLHLKSQDAKYPFESFHYRNRYGVGVGNRLNGVVMELGTGGTYSIPSGYA